jgi:hypothetical protein
MRTRNRVKKWEGSTEKEHVRKSIYLRIQHGDLPVKTKSIMLKKEFTNQNLVFLLLIYGIFLK